MCQTLAEIHINEYDHGQLYDQILISPLEHKAAQEWGKQHGSQAKLKYLKYLWPGAKRLWNSNYAGMGHQSLIHVHMLVMTITNELINLTPPHTAEDWEVGRKGDFKVCNVYSPLQLI